MLYVTAGLTVMFAVVAFLGLQAIDQATDLVFQERLSNAYTTSGILERDLARVADDARETSRLLVPDGGVPAATGMAQRLLDHFRRSKPFLFFEVSGVWLLDARGALLDRAGDPAPPATAQAPGASFVAAAADGYAVLRAAGPVPGRVAFASVATRITDGSSAATLTVVVHTVSTNSTADYVPAAYGRPTSSSPAADANAVTDATAEQYHLEVVDPDGVAVLGIGNDEVPGQTSRHFSAISRLITEGRGAALLHEPGPGETFAPHVMAVVPLTASPFYVVLEQPVDVALALPLELRQRLMLTIAVGFIAALAVAWLTTRHVVRPTEQLTAAAERMAQGDLASPIAVTAQDEVGKLAESLDAMRQRLRAAYDSIEQTNRELESRVAERTARLGQVLRNTISAQEEERRRLARELHDETAQTLAAISIGLDRARDSLDGASPGLDHILAAKENATRLLAETRRLILGLRPSVLDDMGLVPAIRWYCDTHLVAQGIETAIEADLPAARLPRHIEVALFRVVQEAVNNIARHACATHVQIALMVREEAVTVAVADDGRGFDVEGALGQSATSERVGLLGMQERVNLLAGSIQIHSSIGRGTEIVVEAPITEEAA